MRKGRAIVFGMFMRFNFESNPRIDARLGHPPRGLKQSSMGGGLVEGRVKKALKMSSMLKFP